ncbi:MAG: hypothetical protein ACLQJ0_17395 [Steroidobacteraceae bacterium]
MIVRMNQTLRLRAKSFSALKRSAIGFAMRNTTMAIARTTISALKLAVIGVHRPAQRTKDSPGRKVMPASGRARR